MVLRKKNIIFLEIALFFIIAITLICCLSTKAFATSANPPSYVSQYGSTYFDEAYSSGYLCFTIGYGSSGTTTSNISTLRSRVGHGGDDGSWMSWATGADDLIWGTNRNRDNNVYVDHPSGAISNGVYYDVREYDWIVSNDSCAWVLHKYSGGLNFFGDTGDEGGSKKFHREFHFYQAGHCGDPNYEVTFRGVMRFSDLDGYADSGWSYEGYEIGAGNRGLWSTYPTSVKFDNANKFHGTETPEQSYDHQVVWMQFEGSAASPLKVVYTSTRDHYGSDSNYWGSSIYYNMVDVGWGFPSGAPGNQVFSAATYGVYRFITSMPAFDTWEFRGWYWDAGLTNPVPATQVVTSDMTVYGTYVRTVFPVTTSVVNGNITPSNNEVRAGTNYTVSYSPNSGYLLTSVVVDGSNVSIESYPDSYTFNNLSSAHSVAVTYVAPSASKNWA